MSTQLKNWYQGVLGNADHESEMSFVITLLFGFSILWPVNSTRIEVERVFFFPFYYVNISSTGNIFYRSKVMEFVYDYFILSSSFE